MPPDVRHLRQYLNRLDRFLDRTSLRDVRERTVELGDPRAPATVREALRRVLPVVRREDRSAALKLVAGSEGLDEEGRARRWEFFFDLPRRRARAAVEWVVPLDPDSDAYGRPCVEARFTPFPVPSSLIHRMVENGDLLYRQLRGHWRQEMRRRPPLPLDFRDSDEALTALRAQGLDPTVDELTLSAEATPGAPHSWLAQTRHHEYRTPFE